MKILFALFILLYCNAFDFGVLTSKFGFRAFHNSGFFHLLSQTNAQSVGRDHQNLVCNKLRSADFNEDSIIDESDYSVLYLIAMRDLETIEQMRGSTTILKQMNLTANDKNIRTLDNIANIDDQDVSLFYNYLTNHIPFCPYSRHHL